MNKQLKESFVTTLDYMDYPEYAERGKLLRHRGDSIIGQLKSVFDILRVANDSRILLLDSSSGSIHPDLLAAACMSFWNRSRRPMVVMIGALWHKDNGVQGIIQKMILKLADKAIFRYVTISKDQFPVISAAWEIPQDKLRFIPYFYTLRRRIYANLRL